jgi:GT2 family glycosyltransferase
MNDVSDPEALVGFAGDAAALPGSDVAPEPPLRWHVDEITEAGVVGWVFAAHDPQHRCVVELREAGRLHASAVASRFRPGLREAGLGDGACAFLLPLPQALLDGEEHLLDVVEEASGLALTPQKLRWRSQAGAAVRASSSARSEPPPDEQHSTQWPAAEAAPVRTRLTLASSGGAAPGCIDSFAYSGQLGGWVVFGWVSLDWDDSGDPPTCTLTFGENEITAEGVLCLYPRADVKKFGLGFVLWVAGQGGSREIEGVALRSRERFCRLPPSQTLEKLAEADAISRAKVNLQIAPRSDRRARLLKLLSRAAYAGRDTLDTLVLPVFIEIDAAYMCPPSGLLIRGWFADAFSQVAAMRVRCGTRSAPLDPARWIAIPRPDVTEGLGVRHGFSTERCGFLAFVADAYNPDDILYFELETRSGEVVFKRLSMPPRSAGIASIKDVLGCFDLRHEELVSGYDHVVGPALAAINAFRLSTQPKYACLEFGAAPARPRCTIIVPLHGRIDFMEYQLAFLSRTLAVDHEIIYVLDDPSRLRATETLAASCLARFRRPFTLVTLASNLGYAPANNVGLALARGEHVCFLNSDVFPKSADWLESMLRTAALRPEVGAVGALLLFEDETVQHEGCAYAELAEFGGWRFGLHPNKGLRPRRTEGVEPAEAVTGACLLMPTALARAVGGFDEGYIIGDFEDIDLCCKIRDLGHVCVLDRAAQLYHLERQSQGGQQTSWRLNLTLYNAWRFQRRWPASGVALATDADPA